MISSATLIALLETDAKRALRFPQECWTEMLSLLESTYPDVASFPKHPPSDQSLCMERISRMRHFVIALLSEWV
jgi:hypothetical protein